MTPIDELIHEIRRVHLEFGRDPREILEAMRDEGNIQCTDEELEEWALRART